MIAIYRAAWGRSTHRYRVVRSRQTRRALHDQQRDATTEGSCYAELRWPAPAFAVYQVNAVVPAGVTPGSNVQVVLALAGQISPPVTIAVR